MQGSGRCIIFVNWGRTNLSRLECVAVQWRCACCISRKASLMSPTPLLSQLSCVPATFYCSLSRAARKHRANWLLLLQHAESIINEFNNNVFKCCAPALKRFLIKINKFCIVSWDMILRPLWKARFAPAFIPRGDIFSLSLSIKRKHHTHIYAGTRSVVQKPIGNCG